MPFSSVALTLIASAALATAVRADPPTDRNPLETLQGAIDDMVARVAPCVVALHTERRAPTEPDEHSDDPPRTLVQTGSGVIIRPDGAILTSEHVVHGATRITVTLSDGRRADGTLVGADVRSDLAVIRVSLSGLRPAEFGEVAQVRRGHIVFALGNPMGLAADGQAAVSQGIVSAIGRALPQQFGRDQDRYYGDLIQTSAPINPGNSGGPLVDVHGRVIGIVTAIMTRTGASEGIGFAVPIGARTRAIIDKLLRGDAVEYGYLGIDMRPCRADEASKAGLADGAAAVVKQVVQRGPADRAGVQPGDILIRFAGRPVESPDHLLRSIGAAAPGESVRIELWRDGKRRTLDAAIGKRPAGLTSLDRRDGAFEWRGALLAPLSESMRRQARVAAGAMLVQAVEPGSSAERAGLAAGDIITDVNGAVLTAPLAGVDALSQSEGPVKVGRVGKGLATVDP